MITELFDDKYLTSQREKWLKIGLCTEPENRKESEKGIDLAYELAGLKPPSRKIWLDSPLEGAIAAEKMAHKMLVFCLFTIVSEKTFQKFHCLMA